MTINSSSIPALRAARAAKKRRRAEGGEVFPADIRRVYIRPDAPQGADESHLAGRASTPPRSSAAFGVLSPGEEAMDQQQLHDTQSGNFLSKAGSFLGNVAKGMFWDLPHHAIKHSQQNPLPGLRREDYTDIPADTSPDERSAFGGIGVKVPRVGWQPVDPMVGDSLETGLNMAGTSLPFAQKGAAGIFGGRLAKTADHEALARAERMTAEGVPPEQIWQETGWFKGPDDQWRFEISDRGTGYKRIRRPGIIDNYPISTPHTAEVGVYQHPDLYAAYPDLERTQLNFGYLGPGINGSYRKPVKPSPGDLIEPPPEAVNIANPKERYGDNMAKARSTTLHELQHAVQHREGFVPGGNPGEMVDVVQAGIDARFLKGAEARGVPPEEALAAFRKETGRDPHPAAPIIAKNLSADDLERIANDPHEAYRRLYGEVEARNVQKRAELSPEQRRSLFPRASEDIPENLQTLGRNRPGQAKIMAEIDRIIDAERVAKGAVSEPAQAAVAATPEAAGDVGGGLAGAAGGRGSLAEAPRAAARWAGERAPLEGLPVKPQYIGGHGFLQPGPIGKIHDVAEDYMRTVHPDRPYTPPTKYHPLDPEHSKAIAQAYEDMKHTPNDPATKASYDALIDETAKQYEAIKKTGLKIEPIPAGAADPYAANPRLAAWDVAENNHLWFFPTEGGFGTLNKISDNPMLRKTGEKIGDHELLANDMFRIVHDYFGHLKEGHGFRAAGEDNAWRTHAAMYSDIARPAMTTETRGQNSWVNYGPHGDKNRTASAADTVYADQKVGLMPEWVMRDRGTPDPLIFYNGSPHSFSRMDYSKIGTGEGNAAFGHGLYGAKNEPVSEWYRWQLSTRSDPLLAKYGLQEDGSRLGIHLAEQGGDAASLARAYTQLRDDLIKGGDTTKAAKNQIDLYQRRIDYLSDPKRATGHMYEVAADVRPEQLLDYDNPFKEQSQYVQGRTGDAMKQSVDRQIDAIKHSLSRGTQGTGSRERKLLPGNRAALEGRLLSLEQTGHSSFPGKEIYKRMGLPAKTEAEGIVRASERLKERGIPGHRYLDAGSRTADGVVPKGATHNYVFYGDDMLRILRKYGVVGIPAAGVMGADGEVRRAEGGRVAAFGVLSPAEEAEMNPPPRLTFARPEPDTSPVRFRTASPLVNITERDIDRGIDVGLGAATVGPSKGLPVGRIADDTGAAMDVARRSKRYAEPEYTEGGHRIINKGRENPPDPSIQTVADPYRMMYPGIYSNPRVIAEEAAARVGPEDPMMKRLWGVTRGDLREMAQGRVGNEAPTIKEAGPRSRGSLSAQNIQTPQNTQRLIDILEEGGKHEGLRTADAWYIMDPVYRRMVEMGSNDPVRQYRQFNTLTGMASPGSNVNTEIARGTAANWLQNKGRFEDFRKFAGIPENMRARVAFPSDMRAVPGHPYHRTSQADPMAKYLEKGYIDSDAAKVPLYVHASGVPETGFQTSGPVGDAHFSRGVGLTDTRKGPTDVQGSFSRPEYQTLQPWWQHEVAGQVGLESVPAQARLWTVLGPQTGVESALGAPKLELLTQQIMEASRRLGISPEKARDLVLQGRIGAFERGGAVDAAMSIARRRKSGGKVHLGPIIGDTGGRADKVPMSVPNGAYVLTADHVSGLGEGNTEAGMKKMSALFPKSKPSRMRSLPDAVPILAADGEFVISPEDIVDRFGELEYGHRALDEWQTSERQRLIETLQNLAPPAQD